MVDVDTYGRNTESVYETVAALSSGHRAPLLPLVDESTLLSPTPIKNQVVFKGSCCKWWKAKYLEVILQDKEKAGEDKEGVCGE